MNESCPACGATELCFCTEEAKQAAIASGKPFEPPPIEPLPVIKAFKRKHVKRKYRENDPTIGRKLGPVRKVVEVIKLQGDQVVVKLECGHTRTEDGSDLASKFLKWRMCTKCSLPDRKKRNGNDEGNEGGEAP